MKNMFFVYMFNLILDFCLILDFLVFLDFHPLTVNFLKAIQYIYSKEKSFENLRYFINLAIPIFYEMRIEYLHRQQKPLLSNRVEKIKSCGSIFELQSLFKNLAQCDTHENMDRYKVQRRKWYIGILIHVLLDCFHLLYDYNQNIVLPHAVYFQWKGSMKEKVV